MQTDVIYTKCRHKWLSKYQLDSLLTLKTIRAKSVCVGILHVTNRV